MDETTAHLSAAIGSRVRQERQARGWTLDRLAEVTGVSRRMLVNVEQGATNPSVGTLLRISDALGVGLPSLVESPGPRPVRLTRHGDGATLWTSDAGGRAVLVAGTRPPDVVELWDWRLAPGDRYTSDAHAPGTEELMQVLDGSVTVTVADQRFDLEVGDALTFPGDVVHGYASDRAARFSLAVLEPGVGTGSHPEAGGA